VPEFHPGKMSYTTKQWIEMLEQLAAGNNWTAANTIYHMQMQLRRTAKM